MNVKKLGRPLLMIAMVSLLAGCIFTGVDDELQRVVQEKVLPTVKPKPIPPVPKPEVVAYLSGDIREPFELPEYLREAAPSDDVLADRYPPELKDHIEEPLEGVDLTSLQMVGILKSPTAGIKVLIKTPKNEVHQVGIGNFLGKKFGKIMEIEEEYIKINETIRSTGAEKWQTKPTELRLKGGINAKAQ